MPGDNVRQRVSFFRTARSAPSGFTLLEMLVVVSLFVLLGSVILDVFVLSLGAQRQASGRQSALNGLRFVAQTITTQIRTSDIDYERYASRSNPAGVQFPDQELLLIGSDGNYYRYFSQNDSLWVEISGSCQTDTVCSFGGGTCAGPGLCGGLTSPLVNSQALRVVQLQFYITPQVSPFVQEACSQNNQCQTFTPSAGVEPGCSICPALPGSCAPFDQRTGFCRCYADAHCPITQRCNFQDHLCAPVNLQPRVTLSIGFQAIAVAAEQPSPLYLQTTIASRVYRR